MKKYFKNYLKEVGRLCKSLRLNDVCSLAEDIREVINEGNTIYICGNGGSLLSSMHFAEDMVKCVRETTGKKIRCIALGSNPGLLTCISNDFNYNDIFKYEFGSLKSSCSEDMLIGLSVSGTSRNVLDVLNYAAKTGAKTALITGNKIDKKQYIMDEYKVGYDHIIQIDSDHFGQVEDVTMMILHMIVNSFSV